MAGCINLYWGHSSEVKVSVKDHTPITAVHSAFVPEIKVLRQNEPSVKISTEEISVSQIHPLKDPLLTCNILQVKVWETEKKFGSNLSVNIWKANPDIRARQRDFIKLKVKPKDLTVYVNHGLFCPIHLIKSCFGSGHWIEYRPWLSTEKWKYYSLSTHI